MTVLKRFFAAIPWNRLRPAPEMLARQPGRDDPRHFIAACTTDRHLAVIYVPAGAVPELAAEDLKGYNRARWFDPRTGKFSRARRPAARTRPPDDRDWVLRLERTQAI